MPINRRNILSGVAAVPTIAALGLIPSDKPSDVECDAEPLPNGSHFQDTSILNVKDFGAIANGEIDDGPAIQAAIDAALSANPTNAVSGSPTTKPPIVFFPAGVYLVRTKVRAQITSHAGPNVDKRRLSLVGASVNSSTIIMDDQTAETAFHFFRGHLTIQDLQFDGGGSYAGTMLELGRAADSDYLNQFSLNRISWTRTGPGGTAVKASWIFDGTWTDCGWFNLGKDSVALDIPAQENNNNNNWAFRRCHWETGVRTTFIRARSNLGGTNYHTNFSFDQCHWETRSYNSYAFDLEGCSRWSFLSAHIVHSNSPDGEESGVEAEDAVSPVRLVHVNNFQFLSGGISRQGPKEPSWSRKLIALGGKIRAVRFTGSYFYTNTSENTDKQTKSDLWEADGRVALSDDRGAGMLSVAGSTINSFNRSEMFDELTGWSDSSSSNVWTSRFDSASKDLVLGYGTDGNDVARDRKDRVRIHKDGGLTFGYASAHQATIAHADTHVFDIPYDSNAAKRGLYIVYADDDPGAYAMVFHSGDTLDTVNAGRLFDVDGPPDENKAVYRLRLVDGNLAITNFRGSNKTVAIVPFGFRL